MLKKTFYLFLLFAFVISLKSFCQPVDTTSFKMNSRLSFYSNEKNGEMILHVPPSLIWRNLNITLKINDKELTSWKGIPADKLLRLPFSLDLVPGIYNIEAEIKSSAGKMFRTTAFSDCP